MLRHAVATPSGAPDSVALQLFLFGPPYVVQGGQPLSIARLQIRLLLYRLGMLEPVPREELAFLFWPDVPDATARRNLTQVLSHLRRALPDTDLLLATQNHIQLDPQQVWSDVAEFDHVCSQPLVPRRLPAVQAVLSRYRGSFLEGVTPGSAEYDHWLFAQQQRLERLYLDTLGAAIESLTNEGQHEEAIKLAHRYLEVDELAEDVHRQLIQLYAQIGDRTAVRQQFETCVAVLERELGVDPLPETRAAYQAVLDPLLPDAVDGFVENPYRGLRPFSEASADLFFGRDRLTHTILARMAEQGPFARFLAIVGPSGSGKSSVVQAGVIPALRRGALPGSQAWRITTVVPSADPLAELAAALLQEAQQPVENLRPMLAANEYGLQHTVQGMLPEDGSELLLVVDQFEELFTLVESEALRQHLLKSLYVAVMEPNSRMRVVITLRADFFGAPLRYPDFGELLRRRTEIVLPLTPEELRQAIVGPGWRASLVLAPELVTTLVTDMDEQPGALPLLQYTLSELFERREERTLTLEAYRASGGVLDALARRADELYLALNATEQQVAQHLFLRLTTLGEGMEDTRRRVPRAELRSLGAPRRVVDKILNLYGRYRLLTFDREPTTHTPTVELAHEILLKRWGRLREWLEQSREALRMQRRLLTAAQEWDNNGHDPSYLARGGRLAQFETLAAFSSIGLSELEQRYLQASVAARSQGEAEKEAVRQRELDHARALATEQQQRAELQVRASRQLRRRAVGLAAVSVIAIVAALFAVLQQREARATATAAVSAQHMAETERGRAEENARLAQANARRAEENALLSRSRELAAAALSSLEVDPERSILLALEAVGTTYDTDRSINLEALNALYQALHTSRLKRTLVHDDWMFDVAFSPDGALIASGGADNTARVRDATSGEERFSFEHTDWVRSIAFSPDGSQLAVAADNAATVWDLSSGERLLHLTDHPDWVTSIHFSPDGKRLATASADGTAVVWEIVSGETLLTLPVQDGGIGAISFSPDGTLLAAAVGDNNARVWDAASGALRYTVPHSAPVNDIAFSPDGNLLATASHDATTVVWNMNEGRKQFTVFGGTDAMLRVAFNPSGTQLVTATANGTAIFSDSTTGRELFRLAGHNERIEGVAFSPDGTLLVTASQDGTVRLWDAVSGHLSGTEDVVWSPDGEFLATVGRDQSLRLWDATAEREKWVATGHSASVWRVAWSPDGKWLATASDDRTARVWDAVTGRELLTLSGHAEGVIDVAFSPNGAYLATSSWDDTVRIWNSTTGKVIHTLERPYFDGMVFQPIALAFSPDGTRLATAGESWGHDSGMMIMWSSESGTDLYTETTANGRGTYRSVAFAPDGKLALGSDTGMVTLSDPASRMYLGQLDGHSALLYTLAFNPEGTRLATGSLDGIVKVWDVNSREEILTLLHENEINGLDWSPDGTRLATASTAGRPRIFILDTEQLLAYTHTRVTRSLTDEECERYLHLEVCPEG